jgi:hypothetical protein
MTKLALGARLPSLYKTCSIFEVAGGIGEPLEYRHRVKEADSRGEGHPLMVAALLHA